MATKSKELSHIGPRQVGSLKMSAQDVADYAALGNIGINISPASVMEMASALGVARSFAMDDQQGGLTAQSIPGAIQFLQTFLPGLVHTVTAARKIDELIGITTVGAWEDEEVVQGVLEPIGTAVPYGDYTNVPLASWNLDWERRTIVRFEKGFQVGKLEEMRAAKMRVDTAAEKRNAAALALDIVRNVVGFYGYNSGNNRTYGFLNDPSLPAYVTVPNGAAGTPGWSTKTFLEITADIRAAIGQLQTQAQGTVDPEDTELTLVLPTNLAQMLTVVSQYGNSVKNWLTETYPKMRVKSAPQLVGANGGANVFYLYAETLSDGVSSDNGRVFDQIVPAKFMPLGVEKRAKSYIEDFANASAGVILKRPYGVVRFTGI